MRRTARAIADRFARVLAAVAADPAARPRQVQVLDEAERAQVLDRLERHRGARPGAGSVPELFAARAARTPDAVAVCCGDAWVSYGELRCGRPAGRVSAGGGARAGAGGGAVPGPGRGDGDRDVAVWLAGAAYLPLDPG